MEYRLNLKITDEVIGLPGAYALAAIESSDGSISRTRGWLDKEFPTNETVEDFFHDLVDEFIPRKSAPTNQVASEPKQTRRKKNG